MKTQKHIERLEYLSRVISKYAHRWNGGECSERLRGWVREYDTFANDTGDKRIAFEAFCEKHNYSKQHDGYDALA